MMKGIRVLSYNHGKKKTHRKPQETVSTALLPFSFDCIKHAHPEQKALVRHRRLTAGLVEENRWDLESSMMLWQVQRHTFSNINNGDNVPDFLGLLWGLMLREHLKNAVQVLLLNRQGESFGRLKSLELHPQGCLWIWEKYYWVYIWQEPSRIKIITF